MKLISKKSILSGSILIPASKSHTIRAVAIASLADGTSTIHNPLISADAVSAVSTYTKLGAKINTSNQSKWIVVGNSGKLPANDTSIDVGNSGTTLRLAVASAALSKNNATFTFTGDNQIQTRPIQPLIDSLKELGATAESNKGNGCAPLIIKGTLKGGKTSIECRTSQYLSSLIMAAPLAENDTEINVPLLFEPDYVNLTLDWLDNQKIEYKNENLKRVTIKGGQKYQAFDRAVPGDFSSATFFMCAAAITNSTVTITGLDLNDSQPDKAVIDYLEQMGATITRGKNFVTIKGGTLQGIEIDMNKTPDALPAMAVTGMFAKGKTALVNVPQARNKETDRIACMAKELTKVGAKVEELPDGLIIHESSIKSAVVDGHHDHRIVMAMAIAGLACEEGITITDAEAMNITFPTFTELMQSINGNLETRN